MAQVKSTILSSNQSTQFYVLLGIVLFLIFTIFLYTVINSQVKKYKLKKQKTKDRINSDHLYLKIMVYLKFLLNENEKKIKNFVPSIGNLKMSDINQKSKFFLENLKNEIQEETKKISFINDELKKILIFSDNLYFTKSNLWNKNLQNEIKSFEEIYQKLNLNDEKLKNLQAIFLEKAKTLYENC